MIDLILTVLTAVPHFSFQLKLISNNFDIDWRSEYAQSLALVAAVCGAVSLLLLLTIVITWVCQCCSSDEITGKSRRKVRRLSTLLFILSVLCFFFLGFSLFGNEHINRGVTTSTNALSDVNRAFRLAMAQAESLNTTCQNATLHIKHLEDIVHKKSKEQGVNQTLVSQVDTLLTSISDSMDLVTDRLNGMHKVLGGVSVLETAHVYAERIEIERWILLVLLLSIMLCVLFAGVISFCRQSKKGAVMFSGIGIVIFIVIWTTLSFVLPLTVALADFCSSGGVFIRSQLSTPLISSLEFYRKCDERPTHDNVPPVMAASNVSDALSSIQSTKSKLDSLLDTTFNHSDVVSNASAMISDDSTHSLKEIGALESSLACYAYKNDVQSLHYGICQQAVVGSALLTFCLLCLGLFLFTLLIIVSRSWNLFSRLPSDYVEVDEDDPFFPRTTDSNIPVDIYGTHVFNPRTRDRAEPSTNTTSASANGNSLEEQTTPLWNRNSQQPTTSLARGSQFGGDHPYGNYQDRYDV